MVQLFYTTYISVDLAHQAIFHAKVGKGGISIVVYIGRPIPGSRSRLSNNLKEYNGACFKKLLNHPMIFLVMRADIFSFVLHLG